MIVGDMEIRLRADIARLQRDMDDARRVVGNATAGMERAAQSVKAAFGGMLAALGGRELIAMADQYTKFTAQLKLATESQREYSAAYGDVKRIAKDAQAELGATGVLYARIANGTRELGVQQKQVASITETVNLALKVSGATFEESSSAMLQLSQAFASGALRGEEFNAVNEAAPRLMLALAEGIGVPVGALKKMAEEGQITSKIMADVLPKALAGLKEEAKEVQTIAGAFTVLKNNAMEFVGAQAQANGVIAAATAGLGFLANNLTLVAGTVMTLGAAKLGSMLGEWVVATYKQIAAASALRAANIASAEAEVAATGAKLAQLSGAQAMIVVAREEAMAKLASSNASITSARAAIAAAEAAGAQSFALRTVRLATAELSVAEAQRAAMLTELAILGRQQAAVSTQITAAQTAQTAAQTGLNAATTAGIGAAGLASRALGFLGGPIGAVITLLGVGAMAWSHWKSSAVESEKEVARTLAEETDDYIANLQKQIDKLAERNRLAGKGMVSGAAPTNDDDKQREAVMAEIERVSNDATLDIVQKTEVMRAWGARLNIIDQRVSKRAAEEAIAKDREFTSKYADWLGKNGTAAQKEAYELAELRKEYGRITPEMEKWVKAKYADKGAAAGIKQEATAYQNLITSIGEKIAANKLELSGYDKLSESQKMTIKLDAEIATGKTKLGAESIKKARADIEQLAVTEDLIDAQQRAAKAAEVEVKNFSDYLDKMRAGTAAIDGRIEQMQREIDLHGLTASAAIDAERAKLEAKLAAGPATYAELAALDAQIEKLGQLAELTRNKETLDANKKAAEQAAEDWKRSAEQIGQSLTDNLMRGGKSAAEYLRDLFRTLVLRPIIQPIGNALGNFANGAMGMPGAAQAAGGGLSAVTGAASNLYGMLTGGATLAGGLGTGFLGSLAGGLNGAGVGSGLTSALGMNIGNSIASVVGPNVASGIASGLSGLAAAAPWVAGALAVYTIGKKAFGRGPKEFTGEQTLNGSLSAGGFSGTMDAEWVKKGGWFRSDKDGVDRNAVGAEFAAGLASTYDAIKAASADFAQVLGINADSIASRTQVIKIAMGKDEAANQQAIADFFVGVGNTIAGELLPEIAKFQAQGEQASATLQRLATGYAAIDQSLWAIGMAFGAVGTSSLEARERLLAAAGGLEAFAANTAGFAQNFLTEAERNAPVLKMVTEQMSALGLASVDTRDEFKAVVLGLDLTTEAGAKQYGSLMNLQAAFAQVHPAIDHAAIAAKELADAQARANEIAGERKGLQDQLAELTMTSTQLLAKQRDALDASNRALFDQIQAIRSQAAATEAAKSRGANLLSGVDSAFSALQTVVSREKALLQETANAHKALSSALRGTLDSMSVAGRELEDRQSARAQVQAALAIAKAGGVLPDADSLRGALSVLSKDASSMFATQQDYLRDFYATQNDIAALAGLTDDALSVEEQSLKALDGILDSAQQQISALKGIDLSVYSVAQALSGMERALGAAKADPVASAGGSIANLYRELLGRPADSAGLDYWQNAVAGGMSLEQVRKLMMEGAEYKGIPGFASGGMFGGGLRIVGENGPELEATGPSRIYSASQTSDLLSRLSSPSDNSAVLVAAVERLTTENAAIRGELKEVNAALYAIAKNTMNTADHLDAAANGDVPWATKVLGTVTTKEVPA